MEENKKRLMETLIRGRNSAKMLQNLLIGKVKDDGWVSVDNLVMETLGSFYGGLFMLSSCNSNNFSRVPACSHMANLASFTDWPSEVYNGKKPTPAPAMKKRRGCYKRRTMDSRTKVSDTIEDGYAWRKYGQKSVLNSKFPRCYYRCTHKPDHGCKALKQVQKLEHHEESNMFHITYFGHHTCPTPPPQTFSHLGPFISFKDFKNHSSSTHSTAINIHFDLSTSEQKDDTNHVFNNITSSLNQSAAFGSKDTLVHDIDNPCHELASFMGFDHGASCASKSPWDDDKMNLFENDDFWNDIFIDDTMFSEII